MQKLRGRHIAMIFQEPMSALDPVFTVGHQISETIRAHFNVSRKEARERAIEALEAVGIAAPRQRYDEYSTQLSGGMRQRVLIAIALSPLYFWLAAREIYPLYGTYVPHIELSAALVIVLHHANIRRLLNGTEPRIGSKDKGEG